MTIISPVAPSGEKQPAMAPVSASTEETSGYSVRTLRTTEEFDEVCAAWEAAPGDPDSDPRINMAIVSSRPEFVRPHVIVVYSGGRPCSMLLGRIEQTGMNLGFWRLQIRVRPIHLAIESRGPRGSQSEDVCRLLMREVCQAANREGIDFINLGFVPVDSPLYTLALAFPGMMGRDLFVEKRFGYAKTLQASSDAFLLSLRPKRRKQLKHEQKRLHEAFPGSVEVVAVSKETEIDPALDHVENIARRTHLRARGRGFEDTPASRREIRLLAAKGWIRIYLLRIAGDPVAYWVCTQDRGKLRSIYTGYDPSFERFSPGMCLFVSVIQDLCDERGERGTLIDFGWGAFQYKEVLSDRRYCEGNPHIFSLTLRGQLIRLLKALALSLKSFAKWVLQRIGMLRKYEKMLRDAARNRLGNRRAGTSCSQ
jgi:hypothetical protein